MAAGLSARDDGDIVHGVGVLEELAHDGVAALVGAALIAAAVLFNVYAYDIFPAAYPYVVIA